jgi:aminocarboxymuconate-semialdehyde decarboxylase
MNRHLERLAAPGNPPATPVIDSHVHALPAALLDAVTEREIDGVHAVRTDGGWQVTMPGAAAAKLVKPLMADAGARAAWGERQGIDAQLLSPWLDAQPTAAMPDAEARDWARRLNASLVEAAGDVGALATVAITDHAAGDLVRAVVDAGARGLILSTNPARVTGLADPALEPLWEAAAGLDVPVVLHPPTDGPARVLPDSALFGNTYCRLVDTTFAVTALLLSGVLDRHPSLRLVVVHGGGFLPYQSLRLDGGHRADALSSYEIERERPSDYLTDLYFDTVAMTPASIRFLADSVGADHVLLGSDYPFPLGDRTPVASVRDARLSLADTAAVLGGTADRLFRKATRSVHVNAN